jgi:hypothetical protein
MEHPDADNSSETTQTMPKEMSQRKTLEELLKKGLVIMAPSRPGRGLSICGTPLPKPKNTTPS